MLTFKGSRFKTWSSRVLDVERLADHQDYAKLEGQSYMRLEILGTYDVLLVKYGLKWENDNI